MSGGSLGWERGGIEHTTKIGVVGERACDGLSRRATVSAILMFVDAK
jgi:hypothetical protein